MNKKEPMARIASRVRPDQFEYIKTIAEKQNKTEGEVHREIIDYYIEHHEF